MQLQICSHHNISNAHLATLCACRRVIPPYRHACIASADKNEQSLNSSTRNNNTEIK